MCSTSQSEEPALIKTVSAPSVHLILKHILPRIFSVTDAGLPSIAHLEFGLLFINIRMNLYSVRLSIIIALGPATWTLRVYIELHWPAINSVLKINRCTFRCSFALSGCFVPFFRFVYQAAPCRSVWGKGFPPFDRNFQALYGFRFLSLKRSLSRPT